MGLSVEDFCVKGYLIAVKFFTQRAWLLVFLLLALMLCSCAAPHAGRTTRTGEPERKIVMINADGSRSYVRDRVASAGLIARAWEWNPTLSPTGPVEMEIVLEEQRLYIYRNGVEIGYSTISTGREGQDTRPGEFRVIGKNKDHVSNLWGRWVDSRGNVVNPSVRVDEKRPPGVKWEGSPMPYFLRLTNDGVGLHEGFLPGYPASAGCIRVHDGMAAKIFEIAKIGTPVRIVNYRNYRAWPSYSAGQYPYF